MDNQHRLLKTLSTTFQVTSMILLMFVYVTNSLATLRLVDILTDAIQEGRMGLSWVCTKTCKRIVTDGALVDVELLVVVSTLLGCLHFLLIAIKRGKYSYMCGPFNLFGGILSAAAMIIYGIKSEEIAKKNVPHYVTTSVTLGYTFYVTLATSGCNVVAGLVTVYAAFYELV